VKYVIKRTGPARVPFDLDKDLNPEQRRVVEAPAQRLLVLAGAGTGKTRTLTYRVARLVSLGCPPEQLMLVTFTNRAAKDMTARVEGLIAMDMGRAAAGTFHHVGNKILRTHAERLGLTPDFGILDPEDARGLLSSVIAELGATLLTSRRFPSPKVLSNVISLRRGMQCSLQATLEARFPKFLDHAKSIERVANRFETRKRQLNVCDFDDLLTGWLQILKDPSLKDAGDAMRETYRHVLVDEYQDINALQGAIVDEISSCHGSLTCVGDDAQSIYSFRGADFSKIFQFDARHPGSEVMKLTINYRSTPEILALANRSIDHNRKQHRKELRAVRKSGPKPALLRLRDPYQQAEFVAQRVLELHHDQQIPLRKIAVLYRNHAHSLELQVELTRRQIPYAIRSGIRFFEQAHVKDVVAYLRARENPRDELAWMRLLKLWPGVGQQTAQEVMDALVGDEEVPPPPSAATLRAQSAVGSARSQSSLGHLASLWEAIEAPEHQAPGAVIRAVVEKQYGEYVDRAFPNAKDRREDLENLAAFAQRYENASSFLAELALISGISASQTLATDAPDDKLVLTTIHQAKGLEWPVCFLIHLAEGKFPSPIAAKIPSEVEEERRLFYVGVTRAADELYLTYPTIEEAAAGPARLLRPSRFVAEIEYEPAVFERWEVEEAPLDAGPEAPTS